MQKFADVVRGYIVAYPEEDSAYRDSAPWWGRYEAARAALFDSWRLRGGVCTAQHVRECFRWLSLDIGASLLLTIAGLWDAHWAAAPGSVCLLSMLHEELKQQLLQNCTWILYWSYEPDLGTSILVGKLAPHVC